MPGNENLNKDMARFGLGKATRLDADAVELTLERDYAAPPEAVWAMLTEPEKTVMWWAMVRGMPRTGSSFDLRWLNVKDLGTDLDWWYGRVIEADAPHVWEISNAMHGRIRAELTPVRLPEGPGTHLVFRNVISVPEEVVLRSLAGWHVHLDHLQEALEGRSVDWPHWWEDFYPSWETIHAAYLADRA
ncbi:SRPBCC domain-containing protein [Specibacter cremeus]|uniref:SRPBCC domain-containing protein n=1 Tax=Specibacter cremeus TaxID=1629051 RepID=UPI000F774008|nr:SRPBCC domain-containing protein [Specibacter cremeus]